MKVQTDVIKDKRKDVEELESVEEFETAVMLDLDTMWKAWKEKVQGETDEY